MDSIANVAKDKETGKKEAGKVASSQMLPSRRLTWRLAIKRLGLAACSSGLALVLLEVAIRLVTNVSPGLSENDPRIGQRFLRSFEGDVYNWEADRKVALRFNADGFRGPDRPRAKPPGVHRIAILGDSMVASLAVDESRTMVGQLERLLNESHPDGNWEVFNFGVNGASPAQELVLYRELVSQYEPDVVISAFFAGNDLSDNCSRLSTNRRIYFDFDEAGQLRQLPLSLSRSYVSRFLNRHSRLYVWQRTALSELRYHMYRKVGKLEPGHWVFCRSEPPDVAHAWRITERVYETFRDEVESRGSRFAVILLPNAPQLYADAFAEVRLEAGEYGQEFSPENPVERLSAICERAGIPFASLLDGFRQAAPSSSSKVTEEWLFNLGKGHFNSKGDELAARVVHRFLTEGDARQATRPLLAR